MYRNLKENKFDENDPKYLKRNDQVMLTLTLNFLTMIGCNPRRQSIWSKINFFFVCVGTAYIFGWFLLEATWRFDGLEGMKRIYLMPSELVLVGKMFMFHFNLPIIDQMLREIATFWPIDKFGEETETKFYNLYHRFYVICASFMAYIYACGIFTILPPLFSGPPELVYKGSHPCDPNNPYCWSILMLWHIATLMWQHMPGSGGCDILFLSGVAYLMTECKSIHLAFEELKLLKPEQIHLGHIIEEHNKVIKFVKTMNKLFSNLLLVQILATLGNLIFCFYLASSEDFDFGGTSYYAILSIAFSGQLLIYCVGGTLVSDNIESITGSAYDAHWYLRGNIQLRRDLAFIIQANQNIKRLNAGMTYELNLMLFLTVFRSAGSYCAMLLQLKKD